MEPLELGKILAALHQSESGPGDHAYEFAALYSGAQRTANDALFQETENPSNRDVEVTVEESTIPDDAALDQMRLMLIQFFLAVSKKDDLCLLWSLPDLIAESIVRKNFSLFGYFRQQHDFIRIRITHLGHHEAEKARAVASIFHQVSNPHAKTQVFMIGADDDVKKFSWGHRSLFQGKSIGPLNSMWRPAFLNEQVQDLNGNWTRRVRWAKIQNDGVYFFDPIMFESQKLLFQEVLKWLLMFDAPSIVFCTLVICMNHDPLTVTKQDNVLNALSSLLLPWTRMGPKKSKVLILKGNMKNQQSTQEALETLVKATLSGPDLQLDNTTGQLRIGYGLSPQEPIDPKLMQLVARSNSQESEGPVSADLRTWCENFQRPLLWGRLHATTGQQQGFNFIVSMNRVPRGGRAVQVQRTDQGFGMGTNFNSRQLIVRTLKRTKEDKREERQRLKEESKGNGKQPMEF